MNRMTFPIIPEETARAARAIFGKSNFYMWIGDHTAELFFNLPPYHPPQELRKAPLTAPMFFLFTIFQYIETLPDRRAVDAIRERVDWKYGLHLPINFPELNVDWLCTFRRWLRSDPAGLQIFQACLLRLPENSPLPCAKGLKSDALQIVNHVCWLNRTTEVWETMGHALGAVAMANPEWLRVHSLPHWYARYGQKPGQWGERFEKPDWEELVRGIGSDGSYLLNAVLKAGKPELTDLPEISGLKQVLQEQYEQVDGEIIWRRDNCAECRRQEQALMQSGWRLRSQ